MAHRKVVADEPTAESPLNIVIQDASTKEDQILFTIEMKTLIPQYEKNLFQVSRRHEDFIWLHGVLSSNPKYTGIIMPAPPPKPVFQVNRESISVYTEDESMESSEYKVMRAELEREYLAIFKKAVCNHELFLKRIAEVPQLRINSAFIEFTTSKEPLVYSSSAVSYIKGFFKNIKKSFDTNITPIFSNVIEPEKFFEEEGHFIEKYISSLKVCCDRADSMTLAQKRVANCMIKLSSELNNVSSHQHNSLASVFDTFGTYIDHVRKFESMLSSNEDLRLTETFRNLIASSQSGRDLLRRRLTCFQQTGKCLKALNKAKESNNNVSIADDEYQQSLKKFDDISESAKSELKRDHKQRARVYKYSLSEYCTSQIDNYKHMMRETSKIIEWMEGNNCT